MAVAQYELPVLSPEPQDRLTSLLARQAQIDSQIVTIRRLALVELCGPPVVGIIVGKPTEGMIVGLVSFGLGGLLMRRFERQAREVGLSIEGEVTCQPLLAEEMLR